MRAYVATWGPAVAGATCFVAALPLYMSYETRDVLGRWSTPYALVLLFFAGAWLVLVGASIVLHRRSAGWTGPRGLSATAAAWAVLFWGVAYLVSALDDHAAASRVVDLDLFGSEQPIAALLELAALVCGVVAFLVFAARRAPHAAQNPLLLAGALLALATAGEGAARVKAVFFPTMQGYPTHASRQWARRHVRLNEAGFRDVDHAPTPAPGTRRVGVVGDSYAFGTGIEELDERFAEQLAAGLVDAAGGLWEPVTVARPNTGTLSHLAMLPDLLETAPDAVVLLYVFNDIDYLVRTDSGRPASKYRPGRLLLENSFLWGELFVRARKLGFQVAGPDTTLGPYGDAEILGRQLDNLGAFVDSAATSGAPVVIVPFDNNLGVHPVREAIYTAFLAAARERGLPVCNVAAAFLDVPLERLQLSPLDAHPTPFANRLAAEAALPCVVEALAGG